MTKALTPAIALELGWSLIPTGLDKRPYFDLLPKKSDGKGTWKPFQKRPPTADELRSWLRANSPGFAIVTGALSGIVTFDFDGESGRKLAASWQIRPHRRTGSGGLHWDVRHPGHYVPTLNGKAKAELGSQWPGLDIKGDGGYAVAFGRNARGHYEWLRDAEPDSPVMVPTEVWDFLCRHEIDPEADQVTRGTLQVRTGDWIDFRVEQERLIQAALDQVSNTGRNNAGMWLACQLRDNGYSMGEAAGAMRNFRNRCPPTNTKLQHELYTESELQASLRSAFSRPPRDAWIQKKSTLNSGPGMSVEQLGAESTSPNLQTNANSRCSEERTEVTIRDGSFDDGETLPSTRDQREIPRICANGRQLRAVSSEALTALQKANDPPELFARGNMIVAIVNSDKNRKMISIIGESALRGRLSASADYYKVAKDRNQQDCFPPIEIVRDILSREPADWRFPVLEGLTEFPVMRRDGTILDRAGYDPLTGFYYAPDPDLRIPEIPLHPTGEQIGAARQLIEEVICDFPFVDQASRANTMAGMVTAIVKCAIGAPAPLQLNDAPQAGTGKSLGAEVLSIIATGRAAEMFAAPKDEDEWRKQITTALLSGTSVVVFDNIIRPLDSPELCRALTASLYADRAMKTQEKILVPVNSIFIATGNNIRLGGDMPRRCYWVRLDAKDSKPFLRPAEKFKHPELKAWVLENRGEILAAFLTLARAWFAAGKPRPNMKPLGSFELWTITVGGILEHAGVKGFLGNAIELYDEADTDSAQWESFLAALHCAFCGEAFTSADIASIVADKTWNDEKHTSEPTVRATALREATPDALAEVMDKDIFPRRTGKCFGERVDKRFGKFGIHLKRGTVLHGKQRWLVVIPEAKT